MNDQEAINLLEELVRIPSPSGQEGAVAAHIVHAMARAGFSARVDEVGNAICEIGSGPLHGVLLGHIDTVPGEVPVRMVDGKLYGRGTVDAKGPFAAFLTAAARLAEGCPEMMKFTIIGCVEEEVPSSKGARHVVPRYRPDLCVVGEPSGWERVTLGYKGYLGCSLQMRMGGAHPASQEPTIAEGAFALWQRVLDAAAVFNRNREGPFAQILPTLGSVRTSSDGRYGHAEIDITLRLPVDLSPLMAESWLRKLTPDCEFKINGSVPAWRGERTTPLHRSFARAIARQGGTHRQVVKTGTADLNLVAPVWDCPALAYGPGDSSLDHTPDEHIVLDEYLKGIQVLEGAMVEFSRMTDHETERAARTTV